MKYRKLPLRISGFAVAAAVALTGSPIIAQTTLEEIIVSARKKDENLLETPIAITSFGSQDIEDMGLESIEDVQLYTPGFTYESFNTVPGRLDSSPRFRGVSVDTLAPLRQTASIFVDGIFVINAASGISLNDIERVEVIKGPQSAYFGRNTFGGAVNYITKTPSDELKGQVTSSFATRDDYEVAGSIEGAIVDGLSGRISGSYHEDGGHYTNPIDNSKLGEQETWSVAGSLYFEPTDSFDAKLRLSYLENDDGAPASVSIGQSAHNCGPFFIPAPPSAPDTLVCGDVSVPTSGAALERNTDLQNLPTAATFFQTIQGVSAVGDPRDEIGLDRNVFNASLQLNYDLTDNIQLSSLTGYGKDEVSLLRDGDETGASNFLVVNAREFEMFSQEFRISGVALGDRLDWSLGVNYFEQEFLTAGNFVNPGTGNLFFGDLDPNKEDIETLGIFGSLIYQLTDRLAFTFEGRFQDDEVNEDDDIFNNGVGSEPLNESFTNFLPRVIIDYQVDPETLLYLSYSVGNLPGGFNTDVQDLIANNPVAFAELLGIEPNVGATFDEEELVQVEIGLKHAFADGKGSLSIAVFSLDRNDQAFRRSVALVNAAGTDNYFINAGGSEAVGFELESNYQVMDHLRIQGTLGYVDSKITNFESGIYQEIFGELSAAGQRTSRFPDLSGSISLIADGEISNDMSWFGRIDTSYTGERFTDESNLTTSEAGFLVNLRAGIEMDNTRAEIFVKNATDSDIPTGLQANRDLSLGFAGFSVFGYLAGLRDKRQVGARVVYDF